MSPRADRRARFETIVADVLEPLQRYLHRRAPAADSDDALADVLLVIWRRLDDVPSDAALPWSYAVARRCLANRRRGNERHLHLVDRVAAERPTATELDPQHRIERLDPELGAAIAGLSETEREIVHLWAWEQLEPREIATVLDLTPNAVSVALSRAKRKLRAALDAGSTPHDRQDPPIAGQEPGEDATEQDRSER